MTPIKHCTQCGKCCTKYADGGLVATDEEVIAWEAGRPDIARYVGWRGNQHFIWADPDSGSPLSICPWLTQTSTQRHTCSIYEDRPADCRHYPVTVSQMAQDDCEMLEARDLRQPVLAQQTLDRIMLTSRPPLK